MDAVVVCIKILFQYSCGGTEESIEICQDSRSQSDMGVRIRTPNYCAAMFWCQYIRSLSFGGPPYTLMIF
jgi:hypothetical protein